MKNKPLVLFSLLLTVCLSSCRISYLKTNTMTSDVYSLIGGKQTNNKTISYEVVEGKELLPYFSMKSYLSLYDKYLKDGYHISVEESASESDVYVTNPDNQYLFIAGINVGSQSVVANGDFSDAFINSKDYSKSSLYVGNVTTYEVASKPVSVKTLYYKNMGFSTIRKGGVNYFPLSLLECVFSSSCGVHLFFNYERFVQYMDYEELTGTTYQVNGEVTTAFKEMKNYIKSNMPSMPLYLREDRRASFLYTLENQYGLKYTRNISSMRNYLESQSFFTDFLSDDVYKRNEAYYKTFALLDDGHTSIRDMADFPWLAGEYNQYGTKMMRIISVRQQLSTHRTLAPGDVYYSTDEKLAFLTFDSFSFAQDAYQEDGKTLKTDLSDYHSVNYDTFFYVAAKLEEIKNKGGVEDVVVDISTNGGGTVGIMTKLVTLLAKHNTSDAYLKTDVTDMVQKMTTKVDTNGDGVYNDADVYGNCGFKFHILTSEFSFSCGNAYPFYLKKNGIASIIGVKSGGGECAVSESYLPSGEHFYHSGNLHIGWCVDGRFEGDEAGVEVDTAIEYEDFYNLNKLQTLIN